MFKTLLDKRKITCYSLAKKSGVSYTAVNELYRGERDIEDCSFKNVIALAKALSLSLEEFDEECKKRAAIPNELNKCFWDSDVTSLSLVDHKRYIIPRLLEHGGFEGFMFVMKNYTYEEIKDVAMKSRNLGPKQAYSLMHHFKLDKADMAYFSKRDGNWR